VDLGGDPIRPGVQPPNAREGITISPLVLCKRPVTRKQQGKGASAQPLGAGTWLYGAM
jgi:hypothetical protein